MMPLFFCFAVYASDIPAPATFTDERLAFFETKIRPVLVENCYGCHSHEAKKLKGGFYLDSREGLLDAFLAEPGNAEKSVLIEAVRYKDPKMAMPPKAKLPDAVVADLEKWVEMGLPWPDEAAPGSGKRFDLEARKASHWAWKAPVRSADYDSIDEFIDARLSKEGLEPAPPADRATLIRRVTLDLTGLPPTPQEIDAFLNDTSHDAYQTLVDRLLASPRYGEKWARHFLDLVRYAESFGHEFDFSIPYAWKYRDYVIRAINGDVPYDRFVREHIAGDLIDPRIDPQTQVNEAVKATGWWFLHEQTHSPTEVRQHEADRFDNQVDVLSKTFLGVTVGCARCHDHKFDAISTADYYAMFGYLQSSRQQEAYLDKGGKIEELLAQVRASIAVGQANFDELKPPKTEPSTTDHKDSQLYEDFNAGSFNGWRTTGWSWGDRPTVPGEWDPRSRKAAAVLPGVAHSGFIGDKTVGTIRSPEFDFDINTKNIWLRVYGKGQVRLIMDSYTMDRFNKLLFEGFNVSFDTKGKWQWVQVSDRRGLYLGKAEHRAHLEVIDDNVNAFAAIDEVRFGGDKPPPNPDTALSLASVSPVDDPAFGEQAQHIAEVAAEMPEPERVLAMTDGSGEDSYVHIRGAWRGVGQTVPRRCLTALGGEDMARPDEGSGRRELADKLTEAGNPLTARVQVNRLWHHLFGRGIVPTVDNFGYLGLPPSHHDLLDHLAVVFVEDDHWSNKAMIKRIVMSRAYQRASDKLDPVAEEKDPDNVLLHRQNIRRLTAESLRDSVLFVAGSLKEQRFGPSVDVYLTEFMQGRGRPPQGPLDGGGRRSIYISVRRNFLSPMMLNFDAPIPFSTIGNRNVSNVPAQALALMNDPFVHDQADKWAARLMEDKSQKIAQRVDCIFLSALGRRPGETELKAIKAFIAQEVGQDATDERALANQLLWRELCHAVFNLKGFLYVR